MQLGYPYPKRTAHLKRLFESSSGRTFDLRFQSHLQTFGIYKVPIDLPKYRLNNGRTLAAQAQYLAKHSGVSRGFFSRDLELEEAQQAQHEILTKMVHEKDLLDYFKNHEQEEPFILSHEGFVVNGNRRLCAMRILLNEDRTRYTRFENIDVVILPPATEREIDDLEAQLQIHQDIKADYAWTARAFLYKSRKSEHSYSDDDIAQRYELSPSEVREWTTMLEYADRYLESRNRPGQYEQVEGNEYAFRQLAKNRSKLFKTEGKRNIFEQISYCLIDNADDGRLYDKIPSAGKYLDKVIAGLRTELNLTPVETKTESVELLGGTEETLSDVLEAVEKRENFTKIRSIVTDIVDTETAKEKERKRNDFVLSQIRKANAALTDALQAISDTTDKQGVDAQIESIVRSIESLRRWLHGDPKN